MALLKNNYVTNYLEQALGKQEGRFFKSAISTDDIVGCPLRTYHLLKASRTRVRPYTECVYKNMLAFYNSPDIKVHFHNKDTVDPESKMQGVADLIVEFDETSFVVKFVEVDSEEALNHPLNTDVVSCALSVDVCSVHAGMLILCYQDLRKVHYVDPDDDDLDTLLNKAKQRCSLIFGSIEAEKPPAPRKSLECDGCEFKSLCPLFS
jgi:hypothetical protein